MTQATQDLEVQRQNGDIIYQPLKAAAKIFRGAMGVVDTTTNYAETGTQAANKKFCGIAAEQADNTSGAAGAETCRFHNRGVFTLPYLNTVPVFDEKVYLVDDSTVGVVGETNPDICVGTVVRSNTADGTVDVDITRRDP